MSEHHPATEVVFMKGAQVGGTESALNALGYIMDHAPGPTMVVMPTDGTAADWSRDRLGAMIRSTPCLDEIFGPSSRNPDNATKRKKFPGGYIKIAHATSASELRSRPIRYLFLDEIDGYPIDVDGEGDPVELAERRTSTYSTTKKVVKVSTPTFKSTSRVEPAYEASDRRKYHVPCPYCGTMQSIEWEQIHWEGEETDSPDPETAYMQCIECDGRIEESSKTQMLADGEWVATNPDAPEGVVGFHLSALYSPYGWFSWAEAARKWIAAKASKTPELLRTFFNTVLGVAFEVQGERPDWEKLYLRRRDYPQGTVPGGALVLTCGVDVQKDRLEYEVVGWGRQQRSWSVEYGVISGDTADDKVWRKLDELMDRKFRHEKGGQLEIAMMGVDSGYRSGKVYRWCSQYHPSRVLALKGRDNLATPISKTRAAEHSKSGKKIRTGAYLMHVGTNTLKRELYGWLGLPLPAEDAEESPSGWCEFPEYGQEYFQQLTAEQEVTRVRRGRTVYTFEKIRDRNEALDCRIYARAMAIHHGIDRWSEARWRQIWSMLSTSKRKKKSRPGRPEGGRRPSGGRSGRRKSRDSYWEE